MTRRRYQSERRGAVFVFAVLVMVIILGFAALVVDVGYLANTRSELQRAADAAALAASWEYAQALADKEEADDSEVTARTAANAAVAENDVCKNTVAMADNDLRLGYLGDFANRSAALDTTDPSKFNAIEVTVRRNSELNGRVPFFFARIFGVDGTDAQASATAAMLREIRGFRPPSDESNVYILPIALDLASWNTCYLGGGDDNWCHNEDGTVTWGQDGIPEVNLYPKGNGAPGNRGMVDIGSSNNSTADIARQIIYGISKDDFEHHGGSLEFSPDTHTLDLNGDTGISAGVKDELTSIIGETRCIPIFSDVNGPGNNAVYTICRFVGVRIMYVNFAGGKNKKCVMVQPAAIMCKGGIPSTQPDTSDDVFSPIFLVR